MIRAAAALFALTLFGASVGGGCSRAAPDASPEGAVRLFVDKMESSADDPRAMRDAFQMLGPRARANLKERAERAGRGQGKRVEPYEMLAEGRFGLKFRPKTMSAHIDGDDAEVDVRGDGPEERALVHCTREGAAWRVEPELPDPTQPARRGDAGT